MKNFDHVHQLGSKSGKHSSRSAHTDLQYLLKQLHESHVFHCIAFLDGNTMFSKIVCNSTTNIDKENFKSWMDDNLKKLTIGVY